MAREGTCWHDNDLVTDPLDLDLAPLSLLGSPAVVGASRSRVRQVLALGSAAAGTPFRIASLTKPLTAVATLLAARRAGLGLDDPVVDALPHLRDDWAADEQMTLAHVLSQTSGLASTVLADDVSRLGSSDTALVESARLVVRAGSARPPGSTWEYYNGNYFLAGALTATLTGTTFEGAMADLVLGPWGLAATSFGPPPGLAHGVDPNPATTASTYPRGRRPSGGLCSTVEDILVFGEHLLHTPWLLAEVQTVRTGSDDPMQYGLGWAIGPSGQMYLNGRLPGYRSALMILPNYNLVAVVLAASTEALPAAATVLNNLQADLTGDDLSEAIVSFAA